VIGGGKLRPFEQGGVRTAPFCFVKAEGSDLKAPATSGNYTITVNFMNMTYRIQ